MINIYEQNETNFNNNGLATLIPNSCEFTPNINGGWSLTMNHPFDEEKRFMELEKDRILRATGITCVREWQNTTQFFRIYDVRRNLTSVTVIAFPLALEATYDVPIEELDVDDSTGVDAITAVRNYINNNKYTLVCEVTKRASSQYANTNLIALLSGNKDNSFVNRWGGEIAYDDYKILIKNKLGDQSPTTIYPIRYGRNLIGLDHELDMSSVITRIFPISNDGLRLNTWEDVETPIPAGNSYVDSEKILDYPFVRCAFIETNFKLIDTNDNSNTKTAERTREWAESMTNKVKEGAQKMWNIVIDDRMYNPAYLKTIMNGDNGITKYLQNRFEFSHKNWQSLVKSCAKKGVEWIKDEELGDEQWLHLQGYWYGTTDSNGARKNFQVNNYLYDYGNSKWYWFDELGMLSDYVIPQEKIDELNGYYWHYVEGKGYWYGDDNDHWLENCWVEWIDSGESTPKHYWVDERGWMDSEKTDTSTWTWSEEIDGKQYGTDVNHIAVNQYVLIEKVYEWFGADGFWQDWKRVELLDCQWFQTDDGKDWYGSRAKHYAHNEYVYTTEEGHMFETWLDNEGWVDENASGESKFGWHGSGNQTWFGEEGATSEQKNKYIHDKWAYIDGKYYWFNSDGYISPEPDQAYPNWEWGMQVDEKTGRQWFGNTDVNYGLIYIKDQWIQIEGLWYLFDSEGYKENRDAVQADTVSWFANNVYNYAVDTIYGHLMDAYQFLYGGMEDWCAEQFQNGLDRPTVTVNVDLIDLSKTTEYKDYQQLEKICLGDKVKVVDNLGNELEERIVGLTYDCIRGYNTQVVVGNLSKTMSQMLSTSYKGTDHGGELIAGDNVTINGRVISVEDYVGKTVGLTDLIFNNHSVTSGNVAEFGIQAGENITITRRNNIWTISGEGGGALNYFHETQNSLYGEYVLTTPKWSCLDGYYFDYQAVDHYEINESSEHFPLVKANDVPAIVCATICNSSGHIGFYNTGATVFISKSPEGTNYTFTQNDTTYNGGYSVGDTRLGGNCANMVQTYEYDGETWYVACFGSLGLSGGGYPQDGVFHTIAGSDLYNLDQTVARIFQHVDPYKIDKYYSGLRQGDNLAFFAGATDNIGTNANIKIYNDGTTEGLVTEEDLQDYSKLEDLPQIEANPSETPTDVLNSINIDGTAYEIQGGGGGSSGSAYREVVLWNNPTSTASWSNPVTMTLNDDITNYHELKVVFSSQSGETYGYITIPVSEVLAHNYTQYFSNDAIGGASNYVLVNAINEITGYPKDTGTTTYYVKVIGIKYGGSLSPIIYSTEEREVGVWTDNKLLYQKTISFSATTSQRFSVNLGAQDVEHIFLVPDGCYGNGGTWTIPYVIGTDASNNIGGFFDNLGTGNTATFEFRMGQGSAPYNQGGVITVRYTKTTDTAGSGEYNTLGIPNVHYDGNEKVIGTWFGETLYEKSYEIEFQSLITTRTVIGTYDATFKIKEWNCVIEEGATIYDIPYVVSNGGSAIYFNNGSIYLDILGNTGWSAGDICYLTIKYTKSS